MRYWHVVYCACAINQVLFVYSCVSGDEYLALSFFWGGKEVAISPFVGCHYRT